MVVVQNLITLEKLHSESFRSLSCFYSWVSRYLKGDGPKNIFLSGLVVWGFFFVIVHKKLEVLKLPPLFNFCGISATFILIYYMGFTENLYFSMLLLYYSCKQRLQLQASFIVPHPKIMFSVSINELSGIYSMWPAHCTGEMEKIDVFLRASCAHEFHHSKSHQETLNMKSSNVCNSCLFTSGPPNPVIHVWFLICS